MALWCACCPALSTQAQVLFSDDFTRDTDPGPLTPWVASMGIWTVTGENLVGGTNTLYSYGFATLSNNWTNFQVEARIRFPAGAFGGGLGARVNSVTGAHYGAWVYPESSQGGSSVMKLVKFQTWTNFGYQNISYAPVQQVSLPGVGTNWHVVRFTVQGNLLGVYYDDAQVIGLLDTEAQPYASGGVSMDMWTASAGYLMNVDYVTVSDLPSVPTAFDDFYSVPDGRTLSIPEPGVLANDLGGNSSLSAYLATSPSHGVLNLSSNGGFSYTPAAAFAGTDSFTYRATDGTTSSTPATVSITVAHTIPPVANNDSALAVTNAPLSVAPPGVLANDTDASGLTLSTVLVSGPSCGLLNLNANGGFTYTPSNNFAGTDTFTYQATDGQTNSNAATVTILVLSMTNSFSDNFSRGTDPGPLAPWTAESGAWTVTGETLIGGTNSSASYGYAYLTNNWSNYSVEGQLQFPAGAFGGALGGRLNTLTGAHYAAWVYPEGSAGGSSVLKLIKFQNWTDYGYLNTAYAPMQEVGLPGVGTNWHTLKLNFQANLITVQYDGNQVLSTTDQEPQPYAGGGVSAEMWTYVTGYTMSVREVVVDSFLSGTNSLAPVLLSVGLTNGLATLVWSAVPGQMYSLLSKAQLSDSNWITAVSNILATGATASATDSVGPAPQRFYRVIALP
jgi:hypothetical protein